MRQNKRRQRRVKIGLTIKEKLRERQEPTQNIAFQIETTIKHRKNGRETQEKTATTKPTN